MAVHHGVASVCALRFVLKHKVIMHTLNTHTHIHTYTHTQHTHRRKHSSSLCCDVIEV